MEHFQLKVVAKRPLSLDHRVSFQRKHWVERTPFRLSMSPASLRAGLNTAVCLNILRISRASNTNMRSPEACDIEGRTTANQETRSMVACTCQNDHRCARSRGRFLQGLLLQTANTEDSSPKHRSQKALVAVEF